MVCRLTAVALPGSTGRPVWSSPLPCWWELSGHQPCMSSGACRGQVKVLPLPRRVTSQAIAVWSSRPLTAPEVSALQSPTTFPRYSLSLRACACCQEAQPSPCPTASCRACDCPTPRGACRLFSPAGSVLPSELSVEFQTRGHFNLWERS